MMRLAFTSLLGLFIAFPAWAQDDETVAEETAEEAAVAIEDFDREPVRCISPSSIRRTEVIDARTVLFYMRGGDVYRNRLAYDCPRLVREKRFSYELVTNRLCNVDTTFVLEYWGSELRRGMPCGLGDFYPITEEEAELLNIDPSEMFENATAIEETSESAEEREQEREE